MILDLHSKVLVVGSRESCMGGICEKRPGVVSSWPEPIPAVSAEDSPKDTAEPTCKADGAFGKTNL